MSNQTILVIDDSATIRRLVDSTLSPVGYHVVLAPNAEDGVRMARDLSPSLIILDHQLPGTTGVDVCRQLLSDERLAKIPVIASSTLRKKAYVEYADCSNVVDMLPKPYNAELLVTTVANALDTASMVVDSQRQGTAVPEVIEALEEVALSGDFRHFSLRAVLDFLNNANQVGALEVEGNNQRARIYLSRGRVQAITASGMDFDHVCEQLPESLKDLGPVLQLTLGGRGGAQIDGLVQLLDNRVLDPRLLQKLLRFQAACLLYECFTSKFQTFRFERGCVAPPLHDRLQLDTSAVALLVEGCVALSADRAMKFTSSHVFVRRAIRGQNLDRAGLSATHQKLISLLAEPASLADLAQRASLPDSEIERVLMGFILADLVEVKSQTNGERVVVLETDPQMALRLREAATADGCPYALKVVRDRLSLQLVLKRQKPDVLVLALDSELGQQLLDELPRDKTYDLQDIIWLGIGGERSSDWSPSQTPGCLPRPYTLEELFEFVAAARDHGGIQVLATV